MKQNFSPKRKLKIVAMVVIALLAFGTIVMLLWNAILPNILPVKSISFLQALGILLLSKILFGGFRGWGGRPRGRWAEMQDKMASLSPEEREKLKAEWRNRCGTKWRTDKMQKDGENE